jgi:hypothetical protein
VVITGDAAVDGIDVEAAVAAFSHNLQLESQSRARINRA